ncbi:opsin 9 [Aplochiton taeniatus]
MSMGGNGSRRSSVSFPSSVRPSFRSHLSPSADLGVAIFLIITGFVSVLGNGTVLLVYCRKRKKLRPPELMTINLAVCDFGYSLLGAPCIAISSLAHAWVFGETGCLVYGVQGFVFGIGSLITTSLISLDRCLKICYFRYGQWIERRHASISIMVVWAYTMFWALLPAFGFGSYGPEPFGTSCTINWWRMKSFLNDRVYIFLILVLCFGIPTLTIIVSYIAILLTVSRSHRTLASIPSASVTHSSRDLRLTKIAAVVCGSFLLAWTPYALVSLYSALASREEHGAEGGLLVDHNGTGHDGFPNIPHVLGLSSLLNWTSTEDYDGGHGGVRYNHGASWWDGTDPNPHAATEHSVHPATHSSTHGHQVVPERHSEQPMSCLSPIMTLIPAMLAKSHCMFNPFIYQIMNREFRDDVYEIVFGREKGEKRRARRQGSCETHRSSVSLSHCQSWRKKSNPTTLSMVDLGKKQGGSVKAKGGRESWTDNPSVGWQSLEVGSLDTQVKEEKAGKTGVEMEVGEKELGGSTSSSMLND